MFSDEFRILTNIYDDIFLRKWITPKSRQLFSRKIHLHVCRINCQMKWWNTLKQFVGSWAVLIWFETWDKEEHRNLILLLTPHFARSNYMIGFALFIPWKIFYIKIWNLKCLGINISYNLQILNVLRQVISRKQIKMSLLTHLNIT